MASQTKAEAGFKACEKDYWLTYYTPDSQVKDTDILVDFPMSPQSNVPIEET